MTRKTTRRRVNSEDFKPTAKEEKEANRRLLEHPANRADYRLHPLRLDPRCLPAEFYYDTVNWRGEPCAYILWKIVNLGASGRWAFASYHVAKWEAEAIREMIAKRNEVESFVILGIDDPVLLDAGVRHGYDLDRRGVLTRNALLPLILTYVESWGGAEGGP